MTDPNTPQTDEEPVSGPPADPDAPPEPEGSPEGPEAASDDDALATVRQEAARRRIEARDASALADRLSTVLTERTVAAACAEVLADPSDYQRFTADAIPVDEEGFPDAEAIRAEAERIATEHPRVAKRRFAPVESGPQGTDQPGPSTILGAVRAMT
ncbi:MAG: hypothetical protein ACR2JF_03365 [Iamia sp.]